MSAAATAATASTSYTIKATLNTKQEVPKPKDAVHAKGVFTGKITWRARRAASPGR